MKRDDLFNVQQYACYHVGAFAVVLCYIDKAMNPHGNVTRGDRCDA